MGDGGCYTGARSCWTARISKSAFYAREIKHRPPSIHQHPLPFPPIPLPPNPPTPLPPRTLPPPPKTQLTPPPFFPTNSQTTHRTPLPSQRRTILHHHARTHPPQHRREHQWTCEMVEYFPIGGLDWGGDLSGVVVEEVF